MSATWPQPAGDFPWGVLGVNALGCLLIGVLAVLVDSTQSRLAWPFLGIGVLGGFTTFSTYALDAVRLLDARPGSALAYVVGTVLMAVATVQLGTSVARTLAARRGSAR